MYVIYLLIDWIERIIADQMVFFLIIYNYYKRNAEEEKGRSPVMA